MGANNSTRKMTLLNDEKAGVIKLSESLAHRLTGQIESGQKSGDESLQPIAKSTPLAPPPAAAIAPSPPPPPPAATVSSPPTPPPIFEEPPQTMIRNEPKEPLSRIEDSQPSQAPVDEIPVWSVYAKEAHLRATQLREEREVELRLKDEEWRRKLLEREKEYIEMTQLKEDQLQNTMEEVEGLFKKVSSQFLCQDRQENVLKCYQNFPNQTLRCSDEVECFARCVDLSRLVSLAKTWTKE